MTDNRNAATGQFSASEPKLGRDSLEEKQGLKRLEDDAAEPLPTYGQNNDDLRAAAEALAEKRADETSEIKERVYLDKDGEPLEANVTLTAEQAARQLADARAAEAKEAERERKAELAKEIDKKRAEALGVDVNDVAPEPKAETEPRQPQLEAQANDVEELIKSRPEIRQAIQAQFEQAETVRAQYAEHLAQAQGLAVAAMFAQFPELQGLTGENLMGAARVIGMDPVRGPQLAQTVARMQAIYQQSVAEQDRARTEQQAKERERFAALALEEDAKVKPILDGMTPAESNEVRGVILEMFSEAGVTANGFAELWNSNPLLRSAMAQKMMINAARYELGKRAKDTIMRSAPRPVLKPGAPGPRANYSDQVIADLSKRLNSASGQEAIRIGAELTKAKREAARNGR